VALASFWMLSPSRRIDPPDRPTKSGRPKYPLALLDAKTMPYILGGDHAIRRVANCTKANPAYGKGVADALARLVAGEPKQD
jgi:hypothetical protein